MIHVINKFNRHLYTTVLADMFRLRHDIFVGERKWLKLAKPDGLEIDQFDTEETTYFLKLAPNQRVLGGMRIYPTTGKTQLNTIFKRTCVLASPPSNPDHYEWSRYFIAEPTYRSEQDYPVHYELYVGILEYAVTAGIQSLSGYIDIGTFVRSGRMDFWDMRQLGIPSDYGGTDGEPLGTGLPIQLMINRTMMRKTRLGWRMNKPVLSLSIGESSPYMDVGFKADVVLKMLNFIQNYPEHVTLVIGFIKALRSANPSTRDTMTSFIQGVIAEEIWEGINPSLMKKTFQNQWTHSIQ